MKRIRLDLTERQARALSVMAHEGGGGTIVDVDALRDLGLKGHDAAAARSALRALDAALGAPVDVRPPSSPEAERAVRALRTVQAVASKGGGTWQAVTAGIEAIEALLADSDPARDGWGVVGCSNCHGGGMIAGVTCRDCGGRGRVATRREVL